MQSLRYKKMIYLDCYPSFGQDDCAALRCLVRKIAKPDCRILEVGSWLGTGSTRVILDELSSISGSKLYCVDTWKGSPNVIRHQQIVEEYDVLSTFRHNVKEACADNLVCQLIMTSRDAAAIIADTQFDLIFIDGDHSYAQTNEDIAMWRQKVRKGGILCGHDCECRPVGSLRERILAARDVDSIDGDGSSFLAIHPGVVIAVQDAFEGKAHLWAEDTLTRADGSQGRATIWDVTLTDGDLA